MKVSRVAAWVSITALAVGGALALGAHSASAVAGGGGDPFGSPRATGGSTTSHATLADSAVEGSFVAVAPCRIVDTRVHDTPLAKGATENFVVSDTNSLTSQGGSSKSCGIPLGATSISASVVSTGAAGAGYLTGYAAGGKPPASSFLNFLKGTTSSSAVLPISKTSGPQLSINAQGSGTNVVIDVTGYSIAPLSALVNSTAALAGGSRATTSDHYGTGLYLVEFDRDITHCSFSATLDGPTGFIEAEDVNVSVDGITNAETVGVGTYNTSGTSTDEAFRLTVTC